VQRAPRAGRDTVSVDGTFEQCFLPGKTVVRAHFGEVAVCQGTGRRGTARSPGGSAEWPTPPRLRSSAAGRALRWGLLVPSDPSVIAGRRYVAAGAATEWCSASTARSGELPERVLALQSKRARTDATGKHPCWPFVERSRRAATRDRPSHWSVISGRGQLESTSRLVRHRARWSSRPSDHLHPPSSVAP
jgi:hypothetical protein